MAVLEKLDEISQALSKVQSDGVIVELMEEASRASRRGEWVEAFTLVDDMSSYYETSYVEGAADLILDESFETLSNQLKARSIREGLSPVAEMGYATTSAAAGRVIQEQNKIYGITAAGVAPVMDEDRFKSLIARSIDESLQGLFEQSRNTINGGFSYFVKQGSHDTQIVNVGGRLITEFTSIPETGACDYCSQRSSFWTPDRDIATGFHDFCRCVLVSRKVME